MLIFASSCGTNTPPTDSFCVVYEPSRLSRSAWKPVLPPAMTVPSADRAEPWEKLSAIDPRFSLTVERNNAKHAKCVKK